MSRKLYKRVAPHNQRVTADGGVTTNNMNDLLLLQRSNEELKDYLKVAFCPELYGSKIRVSGTNNFITKGYSANSIQRELGQELIPEASRTFSIDNDPYWVKSATTTVTSGIATFNSLSSNWHLYNASVLTIGKVYSITYTILTRTAGYLTAQAGNTLAIGRGSVGTFTEILTCSANNRVGFTSSDFVGSIDNISVVEVLSNDLTQTSSTNQPYLDKIAPTEKLSVKNPNGGSRFLTHPTISFGANDEWTVEVVLNYPVKNSGYNGLIGTDVDTKINLFTAQTPYVQVFGGGINSTFNHSTARYVGKVTILTITYKQSLFSGYINGIPIDTFTANYVNTFNFNRIFKAVYFEDVGSIHSYHIFSKALSPQEVATRSSILRSIFPEIPFTRIGEQIWSVRNYEAVATPQGNLIAEMQANGNVEKITNAADREFSSDTGFWVKGTSTIADGVLHVNGKDSNALQRNTVLTIGKYYKLQFTISNYISGSISGSHGSAVSGNGTYNLYFLSNATFFYLYNNVNIQTILDIDNISIQEIGWAGSQELYTGIFNQRKTLGDTDEQATYAAVKAAAMWCHYGGSGAAALDNGAIYGKLYNWFAVKLLQMDIDYYNTANPTALWGWRVPTQADFNTLATTLGGASVAGGKLKKEGTTYWNSPNTGADNSSGFSAIGSGRRQNDGYFFVNNNQFLIHVLDGDKWYEINYNSSYLNAYSAVTNLKSWGGAFRLIKT